MEAALIEIIVQAGGIGALVLVLILNSKERKNFLEYIERKNGYMEKIVDKFDTMLQRHEKNLEDIVRHHEEKNK